MRAVLLLALAGIAWASPSCAQPAVAPARPVEGLRSCANGGLVLPGSNTCLRLGGSVESSLTLGSGPKASPAPLHLNRGGTRLEATGRVNADARIPTEMGPLRVYSSVRLRTPGGALP